MKRRIHDQEYLEQHVDLPEHCKSRIMTQKESVFVSRMQLGAIAIATLLSIYKLTMS